MPAPSALPSLPAQGPTASLMRSFDWAASAFGAPDTWPPHLRSTVAMLLDASQPMRLAWGPQRLLLYNDAYAAILGQRHPSAFGRPMGEVWTEIWDQVGPTLDRVFGGEGLHALDASYEVDRHGHTEEMHVSFTYLPVRDAVSGTVDGALCICQETTAQVDAARAHAMQGKRLQALFDQAPSFMGVMRGPEHRFESANAAFQRLVGRDPVGETVRDAFPDLAGQGFFELLDEVFGTGIPYLGNAVPIAFSPSPGAEPLQHIINFVYQPIREADGTVGGIFVEGHDVTAEHRATEALRLLADNLEQRVEERGRELAHAEAQLRQSQKMEAIGQLTGGIAHDFNNMLQGIVMPLQLIQRKAQSGDVAEVARYVTAGLASAQRAAALTQRLLAFSRRQPLDSRPTDIAAALAGLHPMLASTAGENVDLQVTIAPELWSATTDLHQFENAVLNLAINGRDAMPDGGTLEIVAENVELTARAVAGIAGLPAGDYVRVMVRDSGVGMAEDVLIKAFDPFFTTKPLGQGTGLGLSMIYGYARQSGGYVALESEVARGTVVRLYLPRNDSADTVDLSPAYDSALAPEVAGPHRASVLVVEDDEAVRQLVVELLLAHGLQVTQASTGTEGMHRLAGEQRFDLLLTDVGLPGPNGRQLADYAQETHPGIRVVLMTGYAEQASMRSHFLGQTMELLVKPFGTEQLLAKVDHALARRAVSD
ncbi:response regulator [Xylophilus sp. GOD-11R]|uniref:response regulator n=1 Tax=Xylophilus sp. GOD-11R TaxID=3089814 RepID=UPI00298C67AB|nr:response regulator [Xylophilus sp. GOD-11R]WPB55936.1 PAS domain-containing protein [Xylophilus sp. GOD-11R]